MTQTIALDVHTHLIPVDNAALAQFEGVRWDAGEGVMNIDGHVVGMKSIYQPEKLLAWMEQNTVAHAYVSVPPPTYRQHLRGDETLRWTDYLNAGLTGIAEKAAGKMTALLHLPTEQPAIAADIVREAGASGHRHFAMPAGTGDERTLGLPEFEPLWQALDDLAAFVFFHPGECADGRLSAFYLTNLLGNPYESTVAIAHLVLAGVLERHKHLVPCFAHGGGLTPMVAGRWQRGFDTARPGMTLDAAPPEQMLGRIFVDCICHGEAAAVAAEKTFGEANVVFGSDWPFPMGMIEPHAQLDAFDSKRRQAYVEQNPNQLLDRLDTLQEPNCK